MLRSINGTSFKKKNFSRISSFSMRPFQNFPLRIWVHRLVFRLHFSKLLVVIVRPTNLYAKAIVHFLNRSDSFLLYRECLSSFVRGLVLSHTLTFFLQFFCSRTCEYPDPWIVWSPPPPSTVISLKGESLNYHFGA